LRIAHLVRAAAGALLALLLAGGLLIGWQINTVRMGGAMQLKSKQVADLVADILPPPEYIIEAYLESSLIELDPSQAAVRAKRLAELRRQYDERHAYWAASDLPDDLKRQIVRSTDEPARNFWQILDSRFLPAARTGDQPAMQTAYAELTSAYSAHRQAVDSLVAASGKYQTKVESEAQRTVATMVTTLSVLAVIVFVGVGACTLYLLRRVIHPIAQLSTVTTAMVAGDTPEVPHRGRRDELGDIANALESFRATSAERQRIDAFRLDEQQIVSTALGEQLAALREGDLTRTIDTPFPPAYERLRADFNAAVEALREMISRVNQSTTTIDRGAHEIAAAADDLARRTEASAANLAETNVALHQTELRVREGLEATQATMARAGEAIRAVGEGRATGEEAAASMDRVAASAENIGSVIDGLDKIAFQTRVLAMNAAVEAGRAGAAGSGFAVVADLVSALAQRAEEEARRVRTLIGATREDVGAAVEAVHRMDRQLAAIAEDVDALHELLERHQRDSDDQSRTMSEIATTMAGLDSSTQQNATMVGEASAAARNLSIEVSTLATHAAAFKCDGASELSASASHAPARRRDANRANAAHTPQRFDQPVEGFAPFGRRADDVAPDGVAIH